ncbi:MAG: DUF1553 domain-containing protein [Planctomycetota bacterium]|nr:DUF1553 domain-containing protein [Planctomycetota bacterium]
MSATSRRSGSARRWAVPSATTTSTTPTPRRTSTGSRRSSRTSTRTRASEPPTRRRPSARPRWTCRVRSRTRPRSDRSSSRSRSRRVRPACSPAATGWTRAGRSSTPACRRCCRPSRGTRLDLANWLVRGDHPQTARVVVNRLWAMFFGRGLARDLGDNGSQGGWPTHPELLDWLAVDLVDSGWDLRHVIRSIVTSRAYRQASTARADLAATDPGNVLLGRQRSWRLEAEFVRDLALYASGLLVEQLGGDKGRPYQPAGYYAHLNFPPRKYKADEGAGQYRRGLYVHWQRMFLHPMLRAFDAPTREECTAERSTSNTPLQALTLLNDPTFVEAARVFGARISGWPGDDADRIERAFRAVVVRAPAADEVEVLAEILAEHRAEYRSDEAAARELLGIGLAATPESGTPAELAAWTSVARVLLNLHEGITRR